MRPSESVEGPSSEEGGVYLFFDTETTGIPRNWRAPVTDLTNWPRIVQVAWLECDEDGAVVCEASVLDEGKCRRGSLMKSDSDHEFPQAHFQSGPQSGSSHHKTRQFRRSDQALIEARKLIR